MEQKLLDQLKTMTMGLYFINTAAWGCFICLIVIARAVID
jgi:hypothetical protein